MKYSGIIIKESLKDDSVLELLNFYKEEIWNPPEVEHFQPKTWTAKYFENDNDQIGTIVEKLSEVIKERWYITILSEERVYIIFLNKTFCYEKGNKAKRKIVTEYALRSGVPKNQVFWPELYGD